MNLLVHLLLVVHLLVIFEVLIYVVIHMHTCTYMCPILKLKHGNCCYCCLFFNLCFVNLGISMEYFGRAFL